MERLTTLTESEIKKCNRCLVDKAKKYDIPEDFNFFVGEIYDYVVLSVKKRVGFSVERTDNIVNNYIIRMLERDRFDVVRYKRYDAEKYPGVPYYKWFLMGLNYYIMDYWRETRKKLNHKNIIDTEISKVLKEVSVKNNLNYFWGWNELESSIFMDEIQKYIFNYSKENRCGRFEINAYKLYTLKLEGYSNTEIAKNFGINPSTVSVWIKRLESLILDYIN